MAFEMNMENSIGFETSPKVNIAESEVFDCVRKLEIDEFGSHEERWEKD
jgi:hypothetical protein